MINVTRTFLPPLEEYYELVKEIWDSRWLTNGGPMLKKFSQELSSYFECPYVEVVSNGTIALQVAIKALEIGGGEIITTPYSYVATTTSIMWEGCQPIFVDVDESLSIDPTKIEEAITPRTKAIMATHVYGLPCDVNAIERIAKKYGLYVIYDGAHAAGCRYRGKPLLSYGDVSTLSLHATKLVHSVEGGAIFTPDADLFKKISLMSKFGHRGEDEYVHIGINAKNSELHSAMGILTLRRIHELIAERRGLAKLYDEELVGVALMRPNIPQDLEYNYAYYPIFLESHSQMMKLRTFLSEKGVNCRRYFFPSLNRLPYLDGRFHCPRSEFLSETVLCLPMYNGLSAETVESICSNIKKIT